MRILITGGDGQLARGLRRVLVAHDVAAPPHGELDVADPARVTGFIARLKPEIVVHTAALTDTARCEREPDSAAAINAAGSEHVARAAAGAGARLIAVSTNEVFDGTKDAPYTEDDATAPVNAYGASKLDGERRAISACADTLVVRTSWLYGDGSVNFIEKVRTAAHSRRPLAFVTDEIAGPTSTADLADAIAALIARRAPAGVYHLANSGEASRYEWARAILDLDGATDTPIEPVTTQALREGGYDGPRKPPRSTLANTHAAALGITMRPWRDALEAYFERARVAGR